MKKNLLTAVALLMAAMTLLASCGGNTDVPADTTTAAPDTTTAAVQDTTVADTTVADTTEPEPVVDNTPVTVVDTYVPTTIFDQITTMFESKSAQFAIYSTGSAPYAIRDVYAVSNGKLKSVTVPVHTTGKADANGDLTFTMNVYNNSLGGLKSSPVRKYTLKVNCEKYGLKAATAGIYKMIKIDLTEYDITLAADETVAFYSATDTLHPAYLKENPANKNKALNLLKTDFPQATGFFTKLGTSGLDRSMGTLVYNFEFERTYENQAAYDAILAAEAAYQNMVAELKAKYAGKKLSILGDSISTYGAVSNSTKYNSTIGGNAIWYPNNNSNFYDYTYTYWGRLIVDLGMELCVSNAWSGSRVYGNSANNYTDNMLGRATELDNDNGTPKDASDDINPDVIIVYMGINDLHTGNPMDTKLYRSLSADGADVAAVLDEWMKTTIATYEANSATIVGGKTYKTWEAAYALSLRAMREKYPNAEIYCMTLVRSQDSRDTASAPFDHYNTCIKALAGYFGATIIDQEQGYMLQDNCHAYGSDLKALHPNQQGHALMERLIIETMYEKQK